MKKLDDDMQFVTMPAPVDTFTTQACWALECRVDIPDVKKRLRKHPDKRYAVDALYAIEWLQCELQRATRTEEDDYRDE